VLPSVVALGWPVIYKRGKKKRRDEKERKKRKKKKKKKRAGVAHCAKSKSGALCCASAKLNCWGIVSMQSFRVAASLTARGRHESPPNPVEDRILPAVLIRRNTRHAQTLSASFASAGRHSSPFFSSFLGERGCVVSVVSVMW
jgi:hypothetical protein